MSVTFISWAMLIVPWLSLLFINKNSLKRFTPVTVFTALWVTYTWEYGVANTWWVDDFRLFPSFVTNIPVVLGPFLIGTIWIFHFTFGNYWRYMLVNLLFNILNAYPVNMFFDYIGLLHPVGFPRIGLVLLGLVQASGIYLFQRWMDNAFKKHIREAGGAGPDDYESSSLRLRRKEKAR